MVGDLLFIPRSRGAVHSAKNKYKLIHKNNIKRKIFKKYKKNII